MMTIMLMMMTKKIYTKATKDMHKVENYFYSHEQVYLISFGYTCSVVEIVTDLIHVTYML